MTLEDLIARYRTDANDKVQPYFCTDSEVTAWINDAVNEACLRGRLIHESSDDDIIKIAVIANTSVYQLHAALYELDHVSFALTDETESSPVKLVSREWLDDNVSNWRYLTGDPEFGIQSDKSIRLVPKPENAGTLIMEGYRLPVASLVDPADEPEINPEHHRHLINWALHKGFSMPDAEFFDAKRAAESEEKFIKYFGLRPDFDMRRKVREDEVQHVVAFMP